MSQPLTDDQGLDFEDAAETDFEAEVLARLTAMEERLNSLVTAANSTGENMAWLIANVQGIFQMFNNPETMAKLMGQMMGGGAK
jgi:hypothetical protein